MIKFKEQNKKIKKKKGFTLIELLAVIIILGVLMVIAVPAVTKYINNSKKSGYVDTAKEIINGARTLIHSGSVDVGDENATYYMPSSCVKVSNSNKAKSPYGEFDPAYVIFNYDKDAEQYDYYWMSRDSEGIGVKTPIDADELDIDNIESNITREDFFNGISTINNSQKILLFNDDCSSSTEQNISSFGKLLPVNECSFDGEMVQGAEFIDGQYTYRYMQEVGLENYPPVEVWHSISDDGWGVSLTDKDSTDPVDTRICTSINGKPIVSMSFMFFDSKASDIDVSSFDTSHVKSMLGMFRGASNIKSLDLSSFDTSRLEALSVMFYEDSNLETLNMDNWDLRNMGSTGSVLYGCPKLKTVSTRNWKIPRYLTNWISWSWSGSGSPIETLDVTGWDLSETESLNGLFGGSSSLKSIIGLDTWDTSHVQNIGTMFTSCSSLTSIDLSHFNTSNVTNMSYMFANCSGLTSIDVSHFNTSNVTEMQGMFTNCTGLSNINVSNFDTKNVTSMNNMFSGCSNISSLNLSNFDTRNVEDMYNMFSGCTRLESLDLSSFRTPNLSDYHEMFSYCSNLETLNLDNWDVRNVWLGYDVLYNCDSLESLSLKNWKIPQSFTYFTSNFGINDLSIDTIDVTGWDLTGTKDLSYLFYDATKLKSIVGLNTWNTSSVEDMNHMFMFTGQDASTFDINVSTWNTGNVRDMSYMFSYSGQKSNSWNIGSLANWNVSRVENMQSMFDGTAYYASRFYIDNISNWDTRNVTNMYAMFYGAGAYSNTWAYIGALKVYADNIYAMFGSCGHANAILNIYNNPSSYGDAFYGAATASGSGIVVNYRASVTDIDNIIATKYSSSNVSKGSVIN